MYGGGKCTCLEDRPVACREVCCEEVCNVSGDGCRAENKVCEGSDGKKICCSEGQECRDGSCQCPEGQEVCAKDGTAQQCCPENTVCDNEVKQCCPADENGNYPPELTWDDELYNCMEIKSEQGRCKYIGSKCKEGEVCVQDGSGECCKEENICGDECCEEGEICHNHGCCKTGNVCGEYCRSEGQECLNDSCGPTARVCGDMCCPSGQVCNEGGCTGICAGNPCESIVADEIADVQKERVEQGFEPYLVKTSCEIWEADKGRFCCDILFGELYEGEYLWGCITKLLQTVIMISGVSNGGEIIRR
ncbi:MAG: hypothetical protein J6U64_00915 [Alphaproteobacteria bacterium]|nr:hypothetical protein [Alphaproteobacteria bacterium]